jgi:hypothetical protein
MGAPRMEAALKTRVARMSVVEEIIVEQTRFELGRVLSVVGKGDV